MLLIWIFLAAFAAILFWLTGILLRMTGRLFGLLLSILGWVILAVIAIAIVGTAIYVLPFVLVVAAFAIMKAIL